ncbi:hypothetical protein [Psychrobacter sp. I-STPA10]|uniref:hypothetical protein n=1 Tax=Psychrobacter sp. I-STPA10 TaxID=2585769 RepID=UPI001E298DED|nr:hypothetical protein [Psychrobacter sp. I-STPA10]
MLDMANAYIIDAALSGCVWVMLAFMYFDIIARVTDINHRISTELLAIAIGKLAIKVSIASIPFILIWIFLCWRFAALMIKTQSFGISGIGLLIIVGLVGTVMIWLTLLLVALRHSSYIDIGAIQRQNR